MGIRAQGRISEHGPEAAEPLISFAKIAAVLAVDTAFCPLTTEKYRGCNKLGAADRRTRRLAERDALIRNFALAFHPLLSGRATAAVIAVAIDRYRASSWIFERVSPLRQIHGAVSCGGYCTSTTVRACRRRGLGVRSPASSSLARQHRAKKTSAKATHPGSELKSGTRWDARSRGKTHAQRGR
jgi:hypothetical protein